MKSEYIIGGVLLFFIVVAGIVVYKTPNKNQSGDSALKTLGAEKSSPYVEIENPAGFVNTDNKPIKIADYVGKKVILLDVLTYSCINCQRTFPYLNAWYDKYKDDGFIVIGIHTPEFAFEKDKANVEKAMKEFGVTFPVVLDNDYGTWNALGNKFWPHKYLIDIHGNVVYDHIGEGGYEETETKIQELLKERATVLGTGESVDGGLAASSVPETSIDTKSPETYIGAGRNEYLANGKPGEAGVQNFVLPDAIKSNQLYLGGQWNILSEYAETKDNAIIKYKYNAKEVYLVAESINGGTITVMQDGSVVSEAAGADAPAGTAQVKNSRLYKLIKNPSAGEHTLELKISPGVKAFAFTFG